MKNYLTPLQRHLDHVNQERNKNIWRETISQYFFIIIVGLGGAYFLGQILVYVLGI